MEQFLMNYFVHTGLGWAVAGGMLCVMFGGWGSALGLRVSGSQAAGVLSEKPELFGKLFVLVALPGTQGFYAFITMFMILIFTGLVGGKPVCPPVHGMAMFFVGLCVGIVQYRSALFQGEASAASINLTARKPEESGRSILFPALIETYAVVALLAGILVMYFLSTKEMLDWFQRLSAVPVK
jgi:V/A-type H+-transporting ATPase subunit K